MKIEEYELAYKDLPTLKKIVKNILETNIAVKELNIAKAKTKEEKNMCNQSISNSVKALERVDDVRNFETINNVIVGCGMEAWLYFNQVLSVFSGSFADEKLYQFDEKITKEKTDA